MKTTQNMKLDTVWERCIAMARWVAEWDERRGLYVDVLKRMWLGANGYENGVLISNCFFCDYAERRSPANTAKICPYCPGRAVDKRFNCQNVKYHYSLQIIKPLILNHTLIIKYKNLLLLLPA